MPLLLSPKRLQHLKNMAYTGTVVNVTTGHDSRLWQAMTWDRFEDSYLNIEHPHIHGSGQALHRARSLRTSATQ